MDSTKLSINTIRSLSLDQVHEAKSGHQGMCLGMAPVANLLWAKIMNYDATNAKWANRDRFVLSNGHGSALLYSLLHLSGFNLTLDDLKKFRQLHSKTPGHPESHITEGVDVTTGPLGQGLSNAVGMAIAREHTAARFNKPGFNVVDHFIYVFCGDGCLMEGVTSEASSLAGHLGLGSLIVIYDDNNVTIDGTTDISFTEDVAKRYESYGWHVQTVDNGDDDMQSIENAILTAQKETAKPSIIRLKTTIGYASKVAKKPSAHGYGVSSDEAVAEVKKELGISTEKFHVPAEVKEYWAKARASNEEKIGAWNELMLKYKEAHPKLHIEFNDLYFGTLDTVKLEQVVKTYTKPNATRKMGGEVLNALAEITPQLIGGSADLAGSNCSKIKSSSDFSKDNFAGRNINFGVREHGMVGISNGISAYAPYIPFCASFLTFIGYAFGSARLAALSGHQVLFIFTHDSVALGEDGPTHQPIEVLNMLRSTPNFYVFRPCDGKETSAAYVKALTMRKSPSLFALTRQNLDPVEGTDFNLAMKYGGYVIQDDEGAQLQLVATGSEVPLAVDAAKKLREDGVKVRVISMPCLDLFGEQSDDYKKSVLKTIPTISIEAGSTNGWQKYSHVQIGIDTFGLSAPYQQIWKEFGFTPEAVAAKATKVLDYYTKNSQEVNPLIRPTFD